MGQDSLMRTTTEIEGIIGKRNDCLKAIANKIALLANQKRKEQDRLNVTSIVNMLKGLSYEEQVVILATAISAMVSDSSSGSGNKSTGYDPSSIFKGRGF